MFSYPREGYGWLMCVCGGNGPISDSVHHADSYLTSYPYDSREVSPNPPPIHAE